MEVKTWQAAAVAAAAVAIATAPLTFYQCKRFIQRAKYHESMSLLRKVAAVADEVSESLEELGSQTDDYVVFMRYEKHPEDWYEGRTPGEEVPELPPYPKVSKPTLLATADLLEQETEAMLSFLHDMRYDIEVRQHVRTVFEEVERNLSRLYAIRTVISEADEGETEEAEECKAEEA